MKALALALVLALGGCASVTPIPKIVQVPVAQSCPVPQPVPRPVLVLSTLKPGASPDQVIRAYAATIQQLIGYSRQLASSLDAYREKKR